MNLSALQFVCDILASVFGIIAVGATVLAVREHRRVRREERLAEIAADRAFDRRPFMRGGS